MTHATEWAPSPTSDGEPTATARRFASRVGLTPVITARSVPRVYLTANTAPARLFATGLEPITSAAHDVHAALSGCEDAIDAVRGRDEDLREAFEFARNQLDLAARITAEITSPDSGQIYHLTTQRGTPVSVTDTPRLPMPVGESREELYGLRATLRSALSYIADAVRALGALPTRRVPAAQVLPPLGVLSAAANRLGRIADVVVAHAVLTNRPSPPELPGVGGDVELYANGRAAPYRKAAQRARVRFTPGRVEIITSDGVVSLGQTDQIGTLLWVAPGTTSALAQVMDPTEAWAPQPEVDGLGTVHILDTEGRSLGAIEVSDWASQPTTVVDQALVDSTAGDLPLGAARGLYALESLGIVRGAATIGVPMRRGLAHPPESERSLGQLRPAPHQQPYRGAAASPVGFARRRAARRNLLNLDLGPTLPFSRYLRAPLPWLLAIAPIVAWFGSGRGIFQLSFLAVTLVCLAEPLGSWLWALAQDTMIGARVTARYRAGSGLFAPRLEMRGRDLIMTSRSGHRTRIPGPSDGDLGVVRILRLRWQGSTWGFALADERWRWRAVLPATEWVPGGDPKPLARFAREVGLALAEQDAPPLPRLEQETAAPGEAAARRSFGPRVRALLTLGYIALPAGLLAIFLGPARSGWLAALIFAATFGAAGVSALLARLRLGRAPLA